MPQLTHACHHTTHPRHDAPAPCDPSACWPRQNRVKRGFLEPHGAATKAPQMRCFLQLGLMVLLLLGVGTRAWCRGAVSPQATAPGFAADRALCHGPDTPPALLASGAAAMWGRDVATAGFSLRDSMPATAGPVIVSIRRTTLGTCPSAPPPPSASGSTTNPVWVAVGFNLYAYCDGDPGSKWLSKDPIGERGGVNLYGMVGIDAINDVDYLGLQPSITVTTEVKKTGQVDQYYVVNVLVNQKIHWENCSTKYQNKVPTLAKQKELIANAQKVWSFKSTKEAEVGVSAKFCRLAELSG
jgi:hypothetical protein